MIAKPYTRYKRVRTLNSGDSPSTGTITCYDGVVPGEHGDFSNQFIEITDCYHKIRLHRALFDDIKEWEDKIDALISELQLYREHIGKHSYDIQREINATAPK